MKKQKKSALNEEGTEPKDKSPKIPQRTKIDFTLNIRGLDWTEKQKAFIDLALDKNTKIIFLSGPAGTSKSILAVYCALVLLNEKKISDHYLRKNYSGKCSYFYGNLTRR